MQLALHKNIYLGSNVEYVKFFTLGIYFQGGIYVLTLMDVYGGGLAIIFIAICECAALVWIYGELNNTRSDGG